MKKNLLLEDFYNMVANETNGITITTVRNVLKATYKVILKQLKLNGKIRIRYFGEFDIRQTLAQIISVNNDKCKKSYYQTDRIRVHFTPSQTLLSAINEYDFSLRINVGRPKEGSRKVMAKDIREKRKKEQPENTIAELLNKKIAEEQERKKE